MDRHTPLLIIGAGPFGLAIGAYARRLGIEPLIVGDPMSFWKAHMPTGMYLRSGVEWHLDVGGEWTIERFLAEHNVSRETVKPFPLKAYLDYVDWFTKQAHLDVVQAAVVRLDGAPSSPRGFVATLEDGTRVSAEQAVVAVGFKYFANIPADLASRLPEGTFAHTCDAVRLEAFNGKRCLVVGGRQSAFEWAALLSENGAASVDVSYRHDTPQFAESYWDWTQAVVDRFVAEPGWFRRLTREEREALARRLWVEGRLKLEPWLAPRLDAGGVTMRPRTEIVSTSIAAGAVRVELSTGDAVTVDQIFLATGYKPALARVPFLRSGDLLEHIATQNGSPVLDDAMQSTRPGLYFTSMLAAETFGPFFAFTLSARAAARLIADAVTA